MNSASVSINIHLAIIPCINPASASIIRRIIFINTNCTYKQFFASIQLLLQTSEGLFSSIQIAQIINFFASIQQSILLYFSWLVTISVYLLLGQCIFNVL